MSADRGGYEPVTAGPVEVVAGEVARLDLVLHAAPPSTIQNPSFETGDVAGWTVWGDVDGARAGPWYDVSPRHKDYFLGTASNCGQKDGGVYQTVAAQPGRGLRLGAWVLGFVKKQSSQMKSVLGGRGSSTRRGRRPAPG